MKILVTGCAGFIGYHVCKRLVSEGHEVCGLDNMSSYYDVRLKEARLGELKEKVRFYKADISDSCELQKIFSENKFDMVIHLAAMAGIRNSTIYPIEYIQTNIVGFSNVIDLCRIHNVGRFIFASSSSVYGDEFHQMKVDSCTDKPKSVYAATKKADELLAYSYSHLYGIKATGLRFFTIYGEYGRPDMAYWKFTDCLLKNESITFNNYGEIIRDFTYIGDLVERVSQIVSDDNVGLYKVYNIGSGNPICITNFAYKLFNQMICLDMIERKETFAFKLAPMPDGDAFKTYADTSELEKDYGCKPITPLEVGLRNFLKWYKLYITDNGFNLKE